jgi:hypothetical protein
MAAAGAVFAHLFAFADGKPSPLPGLSFWCLLSVLAVAHFVGESGRWRRWAERLPAPVLGGAYAVALNLTLLLTPDSGKTFIYFQF